MRVLKCLESIILIYGYSMFSIADYIVIPEIKETARSYRNSLLKQIYELYTSQPEINRKENRKRYHAWVRLAHPDVCKRHDFSPVRYSSFKSAFRSAKLPKEERFLSYIKEDRFWFFFSHCDTDGLELILSNTKDIKHRYDMASWEDKEKYIVSRYILGVRKYVDKPVDNKSE
jgi:hypothetical protein